MTGVGVAPSSASSTTSTPCAPRTSTIVRVAGSDSAWVVAHGPEKLAPDGAAPRPALAAPARRALDHPAVAARDVVGEHAGQVDLRARPCLRLAPVDLEQR